jgi:chromosome segregation ATPase
MAMTRANNTAELAHLDAAYEDGFQDGYATAKRELDAVHKLDLDELRGKLIGAQAEREKFRTLFHNKVIAFDAIKVALDRTIHKHELELVDAAENAKDALRKELSKQAKADRDKAAEAISNLETRLAARVTEIHKLEKTIVELRSQIDRFAEERTEWVDKHDAALADLQEAHKEDIEKLEEEHSDRLNDQAAKFDRQLEEDRPLTLEEGFIQGIEDLVRCSTKTTFTLDDLQEIAIDKNHPLRPRF